MFAYAIGACRKWFPLRQADGWHRDSPLLPHPRIGIHRTAVRLCIMMCMTISRRSSHMAHIHINRGPTVHGYMDITPIHPCAGRQQAVHIRASEDRVQARYHRTATGPRHRQISGLQEALRRPRRGDQLAIRPVWRIAGLSEGCRLYRFALCVHCINHSRPSRRPFDCCVAAVYLIGLCISMHKPYSIFIHVHCRLSRRR